LPGRQHYLLLYLVKYLLAKPLAYLLTTLYLVKYLLLFGLSCQSDTQVKHGIVGSKVVSKLSKVALAKKESRKSAS
jgi:hypothetical protein